MLGGVWGDIGQRETKKHQKDLEGSSEADLKGQDATCGVSFGKTDTNLVALSSDSLGAGVRDIFGGMWGAVSNLAEPVLNPDSHRADTGSEKESSVRRDGVEESAMLISACDEFGLEPLLSGERLGALIKLCRQLRESVREGLFLLF